MRKTVLGIFTLAILSSCGKMKDPEFRRVSSAELGKLGLVKSELKLNLVFFNPNRFKGALQWAEGEAWMDSVYLGPFRVENAVVAEAKKEFAIPVILSLNMQQALKLSRDLLQDKGTENLQLKIVGKLRAGRNGIYRTIPMNVMLTQKNL